MALGRLTVKIREGTDDDGEVNDISSIEGEIRTLRLKMKIRLVPIQDRHSDQAPDYTIYGNVVGHFAEVGKAWRYKVKAGDNVGRDMYSLTFLDDEVKQAVSRAAAFPMAGEDKTAYEIVRQSEMRQDSAQEQETAVA